MTRIRRIIAEIHRRSIWQVLGIYLVGSWVAYEVVLNLADGLGLPEWVPPLVVVLFLVGLPIVLATAFVQESPASPGGRSGNSGSGSDGSGRDDSAGGAGALERLFTWRNAAAGFVIAFAALAVGAGAATYLRPASGGGADPTQNAIAALPFANMSADPEDAYFTDGVHEEIVTQLARISALRVISRTSVMGYRATTQNLRQIARDLGVRYVLEGSVRRFGERVRITAQLIDAETDQHLWAETYDRPRADLFEVQADVAEQIAAALRAELTAEERASLNRALTTSTEAHDLFMRGREHARRGDNAGREERRDQWLRSMELFREAVAADPDFAVAWARLAYQHARFSWYRFDPSPARADSARAALRRARELAPDQAEVVMSAGYVYYWAERDYDRALQEYERALRHLPGDAEITNLIGYIKRRQGRFNEAVEHLSRGFQLDPRNGNLALEIGTTHMALRDWVRAEEYLQRAIEVAPDYTEAYERLAYLHVAAHGDTRAARQLLGDALRHVRENELYYPLYWLDMLDRRFADAERRLDGRSGGFRDEQYSLLPLDFLAAHARQARGDSAGARALHRRSLEQLEARLAAEAGLEDSRLAGAIAIARAMLGDHETAARLADRAVDLLPLAVDAYAGSTPMEDRAWVHALAGNTARAVDELAVLLRTPGRVPLTAALLRLDPRWDPIRSDPGFRALTAVR
jgi:TolB-like protein